MQNAWPRPLECNVYNSYVQADAPSINCSEIDASVAINFVEEQLTQHERFFDVANNHPNPLLVSVVSYEPPPSHHFCKRPRNVLLDRPDDLSVEVGKLIELNKMAID
ncbi:hypothetical protein EVAR_54072_1 [Eumeta japonica]|uniref:Uncharacterized protein n=1 Tax=Eumeta variegata TaxID=151549 RepID=A0A4C1XII0_EUMVA|nr:hypothetical protein EVAR_54072_1 [Eumeta japonica]